MATKHIKEDRTISAAVSTKESRKANKRSFSQGKKGKARKKSDKK